MKRYIAYRVERVTGSKPAVWEILGHINERAVERIGAFMSQNEAFQVLKRITGIQCVKGQSYYPVEAHVRAVLARIQFAGIREQLKPDSPEEYGQLAADAEDDEELLFMVKSTQTFFWRALTSLERHLGFEIDSSQDFKEASIESLKASPGASV